MFACQGCAHSLAEVVVRLHIPEGELVRWAVVAARCVECGRLASPTDMVLDNVPVTEVLAVR